MTSRHSDKAYDLALSVVDMDWPQDGYTAVFVCPFCQSATRKHGDKCGHKLAEEIISEYEEDNG